MDMRFGDKRILHHGSIRSEPQERGYGDGLSPSPRIWWMNRVYNEYFNERLTPV
ncbi:hypothetical protein HRbin02_00756 [Candidatus Calditenuaceae archaeon HR02]|nr:hypothetical protein HRbin02_00756 [Candidatus Calditenuaceae archaeon HR02]